MKNTNKVGKLSIYCKKKKISIYRLGQITGVEKTQIGNIDKDYEYNVTTGTMDKIYNGTKKEFGEGLHPSKYLSKRKSKWL